MSTIEEKYKHILAIAEIFDGRDCKSDEISFWKNGENIEFFINCNDYFYWACADSEAIEIGDVPLLKQSIADVEAIYKDTIDKAVYGVSEGKMLFVCRKRKERPQGCCYPSNEALWPLWNDAGPEKPIGMGNPYAPGQRSQAVKIYNNKLSTRIKKAWLALKEHK